MNGIQGNDADFGEGKVLKGVEIYIQIGCGDGDCTTWAGIEGQSVNGNMFEVLGAGTGGHPMAWQVNPDPLYNYQITAGIVSYPPVQGDASTRGPSTSHVTLSVDEDAYFSKKDDRASRPGLMGSFAMDGPLPW